MGLKFALEYFKKNKYMTLIRKWLFLDLDLKKMS